MDFSRVGVLSIFLNIAGTCLWATTMLYLLLKKKRKNIRNAFRKKLIGSNALSFDDEIFTEMLKQQSELSFKRIYNAIKKENMLLGRMIENGARNNAGLSLKSKAYYPKKFDCDIENKKESFCLQGADKYSEVVRFAELGMSAKKISRKVKIPRGEIELLLKLRQQNRKKKISNSQHVETFF